ncbi:sensor histidine kinase [Pedobacter chinensis]|uniref:sensor histidine kinase n=1 Tax=Pedobacter chinensis TaxID=2282421 RepID=UPI001314375D|nr:sensor histidine kinase [Pedobacter chinensis]
MFIYPPMLHRQIKPPADFLIKQIVHILLMFTAYYTNAYYLIPKFLFKSKFGQYGLSITMFVLLSSFSLKLVDSWLGIAEQMENAFGKKMWSNPFIDFFGLLTTLFVLGISTSIAIIDKWGQEKRNREDYESQRTKSELSFLKAQIHPHFFFNTLNSIYALTYTDVEASRKVLYKLSRMMRYLLYETQQNKVTLEKELSFIIDYVNIMKLRVNSNTIVIFPTPEKNDDLYIAPMLLLPFVENAFKHGIDDIEPVTITIIITVSTESLTLTTRNKIIDRTGVSKDDYAEAGIGMANTKRRLELLYPHKHVLGTKVDPLENEYHLNLQINLT